MSVINFLYCLSCDKHIQCVHKKTNYFQHNIIKLQLNALIFGTAICETTANLAMINVFHVTCVLPIPGKTFKTSYILAINKTVKQ